MFLWLRLEKWEFWSNLIYDSKVSQHGKCLLCVLTLSDSGSRRPGPGTAPGLPPRERRLALPLRTGSLIPCKSSRTGQESGHYMEPGTYNDAFISSQLTIEWMCDEASHMCSLKQECRHWK